MRLKVIACKVLFRELSLIASASKNFIDITYMRQGFHNEPDLLRERVQHEIDKIDSGEDWYTCKPYIDNDFDAILLGYGLCSNGIMGLSSRKYRLVVPKGHDCITLLLGSKEKYKAYFDTHKGIYWYSGGWIDNTPMPGKARYDAVRNTYAEKYGEENADYLMEMEQNWYNEYQWCTFVDWPEFDNAEYKAYTKQSAEFLKWNYDEVIGSKSLLTDFLEGNWDESEFLIVPPGKTIEPSYDENVIGIQEKNNVIKKD
ncbi:MAG: DUF1638 domain-containing protein [Firmicutes bacterium]|nr:DUF1638 domain-containing protein [Bacillota bacterium]